MMRIFEKNTYFFLKNLRNYILSSNDYIDILLNLRNREFEWVAIVWESIINGSGNALFVFKSNGEIYLFSVCIDDGKVVSYDEKKLDSLTKIETNMKRRIDICINHIKELSVFELQR
ncbi:hypothetical protein J8I29_25190 [Labrys sp. LIt4]|uniref:hypothetical protein n=1 Tax=Labrys sp. LIt4 TaxID=2821355 RepID=UPI001AE075B5|nr:hypothetical protein [Labrys sp. LIt4]MBP0582645.1 hypothetical protein [Labrys sp. LIt4]